MKNEVFMSSDTVHSVTLLTPLGLLFIPLHGWYIKRTVAMGIEQVATKNLAYYIFMCIQLYVPASREDDDEV